MVRSPNPALSSQEERWSLLCFSVLLGFWVWWVCPSHASNFPFHWQWLISVMQNWSDANIHHGPRHPYKVTVSRDKVMVNVESPQKHNVACCRKQLCTLLGLGLPLRSPDASVCPRLVHVCVCVCVCLFAITHECSRCLCLKCPWNVSLTGN